MQQNRQTLDDALKIAKQARMVVFVSGNFNVVHPGHVRLLKFASECGDCLIVGVNGDGTRGAILPSDARLEGVKSISFVNYAFILDGPIEELIAKLRPHIVVKGKEFELRGNPERPIVESYGGKLMFGSGEARFSSLDLLRREAREYDLGTINKPTDFLDRHGFGWDSLKQIVRKFTSLRVTVIGDLVVDEYITCDPLGMSQEDPTIVVSPIGSERFVGGAGIVAAHARSLGADVQFFSVAGADTTLDFAREVLGRHGVSMNIEIDDSRPTTLKQRFRANGKTLLRVSHLRQHDIARELADRLLAKICEALEASDLLIFSDFNYGCLPQELVDGICEAAKRLGVPMVADSQSSSQVGDISRFKDMLLITPTEREARLAVRDFTSGLVMLAEQLHHAANPGNVVITLGAEGLLAHTRAFSDETRDWVTDQLPAFNTAPKDSAGAGDSFLTCAAMSLVVGASLWQAIYLGSLAAACQVGRVGNLPLKPADLEAEIDG